MGFKNHIRVHFGVIIIFVFVVLSLQASATNISNSSNATNTSVEYDSEILEALEQSSEVRVLVGIRDTSDVTITKDMTEEERRNAKDALKLTLDDKLDSVLSTLSESEFDLIGRFISGHAFYGYVTKEGYDKLLTHPYVKSIILDKPIQLGLAPSSSLIYLNNTLEFDSEILDAFEDRSEVRVIVRFPDIFGLLITDERTEEEKDNLRIATAKMLNDRISVIVSGFSDTEFRLVNRSVSGEFFVGDVTKEGFGKLINISDLASIEMDESVMDSKGSLVKEGSSEKEEASLMESKGESKSFFSRVIGFFKSLFRQ